MNPCLLVQIFPKGCGKTSYLIIQVAVRFRLDCFCREEMSDFQSPIKTCVSSYCNTLNGFWNTQKAVDMENLKKCECGFICLKWWATYFWDGAREHWEEWSWGLEPSGVRKIKFLQIQVAKESLELILLMVKRHLWGGNTLKWPTSFEALKGCSSFTEKMEFQEG